MVWVGSISRLSVTRVGMLLALYLLLYVDETMSKLDVEDFTDIFDHFFGEAFEDIEHEEQLLNQEQQQNNQ